MGESRGVRAMLGHDSARAVVRDPALSPIYEATWIIGTVALGKFGGKGPPPPL
jgi:hypothetical protein